MKLENTQRIVPELSMRSEENPTQWEFPTNWDQIDESQSVPTMSGERCER